MILAEFPECRKPRNGRLMPRVSSRCDHAPGSSDMSEVEERAKGDAEKAGARAEADRRP